MLAVVSDFGHSKRCVVVCHCYFNLQFPTKGDQSWVFTGRTDVEAEVPILWPPDVKS